jgi:hypothetical protein
MENAWNDGKKEEKKEKKQQTRRLLGLTRGIAVG